MTVPSRARWQPQGPASRCVIQGHALGWLNCTPTSFAMGIDKSTLGAKRLTGCDVRESTGDVAGGTTLLQCEPFAEKAGVKVDVYVGSKVVPPYWLAVQMQAGRGCVLQGNTSALISTPFRSTGSGVNHAAWVNDVRGGKLGEPAEALVYDPAADGHQASWGKAAQGPAWWPWSRVIRFAHALHPWGDDDPRTLSSMGIDGVYVAVFPDTEPHVHLRYGASRTSPFPDRLRVNVPAVYTHSTPAYGTANRIEPRLHRDDLFVAFQRVTKPDAVWFGSHDGTRWIPKSKVRNIGGTQ